MNKKILIGCLVSKHHEYCIKEFLEGLKNISYKDCEIILIENSDTDEFYNSINNIKDIKVLRYGNEIKSTQEKLATCRNYLRDIFLKGDYEYLLSLDQDVIPPKNVVESLIKRNKEIVTGICFNNKIINNKEISFPVIYRKYSKETQELMLKNKDKVKQLNLELFEALQKYKWDFEYVHRILTFDEVKGDDLIEIDHCGNACVLIKREVLEKIKFRFEGEFFDDMMFCKDVAKLGYKIYADCSVKCKHIIENRPWKWNKKNDVLEIDYDI